MKKAVVFFVVAAIASIVAYAVTCRADAKIVEKSPSGQSENDKPLALENDKPSVLTIKLAETSVSRVGQTVPALEKPPYKVALIVQNHTSDAPTLPMAAFADTLMARLSGKMFRIVNPHNVIGVNQNRTAHGEEMPEASALNLLAHDPDLAGVITASIQEFTGRDIRHENKVIAHALRVRLAINLMDATGGNVCGIDGFDDSKNCRPEDVKSNTATLYEELMHQAAATAAAKLLVKDELRDWVPTRANLIDVFFGCNVLGADVQVDGMSYGTTPAKLALTPGSHNLLISYPPYYFEYKRRVVFNQKGQRYSVVLQLTEKGEAQRDRALEYAKKLYELESLKKKDASEYARKMRLLDAEIAERCQLFKKQLALADAMLERYSRSGETDDYVRRKMADGKSVFWSNSFNRLLITDGTAENVEFYADADEVVIPSDPIESAKLMWKKFIGR